MQTDHEVIDVEEFHDNLQRNSFEELKRKNYKLKVENQKLDTKVCHLNRFNDAISHKLFEQDQRRNEFARRLGFESMESAEDNITSKDPWMPGGKAALSAARARILLLEDEVAKHITASEEAQSVIKETKEQLEETHRYLDEVLEHVARLREERDFAREEAERQAMDASAWRTEVQTTLPEMQALIRKQQEESRALYVSRFTASSEKANVTPGQLEHSPSPLRKISKTTSPTVVPSSPSSIVRTLEAQRYKQQFELLESQYNALLETKEKISNRFHEQLVKWRKFKHWLVKEEAQYGRRLSMQRRISRKRKVMEQIGPQLRPQGVELDDTTVPTVQTASPEDMLAKLVYDGSIFDAKCATDRLHHHSIALPACPPLKPDTKDLAPLQNTTHFEESFTQPSSVTASQQPTATGYSLGLPSTTRPCDPFIVNNDIPLSQQSLTQPSSPASFSPVRAPRVVMHAILQDVACPAVLVADSPPRKATAVKQKNLRIENAETPKHIATSQSTTSSTSAPETPIRTKIPRTLSKGLLHRHKLMTVQAVSEPPPVSKIRHPSPLTGQAIRRTGTVLVMDTPSHTSARALKRHHSSPSQHLLRLNKRKRRAEEIEDSGDEDESDPFKAGSSLLPVTAGQTRDEKLASLRALSKKPHKEYMAEYMQFKGRGRYSNANAAPSKTINGEFEINQDKNGGLGFQYDTVVRDKNERQRLEAGDCECCRDYYEAIGPLPPRLQAPLWKSPSSGSNEQTARPCRYKSSRNLNSTPTSTEMHLNAVDAHKHSISRHRHHWAPPNTPPGFWEIEFPNTPMVHDINRRADQMHAHKLGRVEAEANSSNGRYRKRK